MSRRGITNRQARYLAILQRKAKEPYSGNGMSRQEAWEAIQRLRKQLGVPEPTTIYQAARASVERTRNRQRAAAVIAAPKAKARTRARRQAAEALPNGVPRINREAPTPTQLHDLAVLARRAGEPKPQPSRRGDAARELARLRSASP